MARDNRLARLLLWVIYWIVVFLVWVMFWSTWSMGVGWSQNQQVVFQGAYQRNFVVTDCSNATPIVVTVQDPTTFNSNDELIFRNMEFMPLDNASLVTIREVEGNTACNVVDQAINVLTPTTFELTGVAGNGAYTEGGIGSSDTISDDIPSVVMPNVGQGGHLISVEFPNENADVSNIQVRIEASDTCPDPPFCANGDWRPISVDIVNAQTPFATGNGRINMVRANGAWRAIRINSLAATPGGETMRVDYTGFIFPIGSVTCTAGITGFCEVTTPFGGGGDLRATFVLCLETPCTVDTNLTNRWLFTDLVHFDTCFAQAKTAPVGADMIFDINFNGTTSIFNPANRLTIPDGANIAPHITEFVVTGGRADDFLTIDIDQVGSGTAGQDVTVVCTLQ